MESSQGRKSVHSELCKDFLNLPKLINDYQESFFEIESIALLGLKTSDSWQRRERFSHPSTYLLHRPLGCGHLLQSKI